MEFQDKTLFDNAVRFLKDCHGKRTHIFHDFDVDGITGGLLLHHTLHRTGANVSSSTKTGRGAPIRKHELEAIKGQHDPERIIITDQDPKNYEVYEEFREVFPDTPLLIIDHHKPQSYTDALFVHPELVYGVRGDKYCSAKLIFDVCEALTDIEDLSWLAAVGILGDANARYFPDFLKDVCEYHDIPIPDDWFDASFAKIAEAIDCCSAVSEEELLRYVTQLKQAQTLEAAIKIGNPCAYVIEEREKYVKQGLALAETDGPVVWVPVESQYNISSEVTTIISFQFPHRIFAGIREQVDGVSINLRYQEAKIHLGELINALAPKYGGRGGGHAPAAGGWIPNKQFAAFREAFDKAVMDALENA